METVFLSEIINTDKDIKETIEYMAITSAPGLDGITASIYEKMKINVSIRLPEDTTR